MLNHVTVVYVPAVDNQNGTYTPIASPSGMVDVAIPVPDGDRDLAHDHSDRQQQVDRSRNHRPSQEEEELNSKEPKNRQCLFAGT